MHTFTISSEARQHLGFLVWLSDDETDAGQASSGYFALKALADTEAQQQCPAHWRVLVELAAFPVLYWQQQGERIRLADPDGTPIGWLQQQFLQLYGQRFLIDSLDGHA